MPLTAMNDVVRADFCVQDGRWGSFSSRNQNGTVSGREVLRDTLYHFELRDTQDKVVLLQVYEGIKGLGRELWEQEVSVLQRLAALQHPALPRLAHGGSVPADDTAARGVDGYAFIMTNAAGDPLHDGGSALDFVDYLEHFQAHPDQAVVQLMTMADALTLLHGMGIAHRNIWPGTVEVDEVDDELVLRLTRFEMSALVSNLLRFASWDSRQRADKARQLVLGQGARAIGYFSPARIRSLFRRDTTSQDHQDDIYGLGMMAVEWFAGGIPEYLVADTEKALRECGDDPEPVVAAAQRVNQHMHDAVRNCPPPLRSLLRDMIALHAPSRPVASSVVDRLSDHFESLVHERDDQATRPYALLFMPKEARKTLLPWEKVRNDPESPMGRVELADFIERDLRRARLYHAPSGVTPFMPPASDDEKKTMSKATYLLLGHEVAWFCQPYQARSRLGKPRGAPLDNVLVVKYPVNADSARGRLVRESVTARKRWRLVPPLEVKPWDIDPQLIEQMKDEAPRWSVLLEAISSRRKPAPAEEKFSTAFDFLLDFQNEELAARRYPYTTADGVGDLVTLQFDKQRDRRWQFSSAMATVFAESTRLRPAMGDFFAASGNGDGEVTVLLRADDNGRPAPGRGVEVEVHGGEHDVVQVAGDRRRHIPPTGWIEFASDVGSRVALNRQQAARWELLTNPVLVEQLDGPHEFGRPPLCHDADLDAVATRMRTSMPFFALQGPPGTGKTEVAATALRQYLADEPFARVLVSAQSNYALDNIAERVLEKLGMLGRAADKGPSDVIALRVTTPDRTLNVDDAIKPFVLGPLADRTYQRLVATLQQAGDDEHDHVVRDLIVDWLGAVEESLPELTDRLHRSANVVFATCSAATRRNLNRGVPADTFDWVVIEEAAKAWPTELAIPLVRGGRWTLIGDHRQLPAHRRREVGEFLVDIAGSDEDDLRQHGRRHDDHIDVFELFGHMFDDKRLPSLERNFHRPRFTMRTQYRMRRAICETVSRTFYPDPAAEEDGAPLPPGLLSTGRDDEGVLQRPGAIAASALVWVDTSAVPDCEDAPTWENKGEVRLIEEMLRRMRPRPIPKTNGYGPHPLAVLSPYRRQVDLLRGPAEIRDHVYTIHAFQGRQADVVVVSLVRDKLRGSPDRPWQSIGHLTQPELVNVMLSRAKSHLVLVGSLAHFERCGDPTWKNVCALVRHFGTVVPGTELGD